MKLTFEHAAIDVKLENGVVVLDVRHTDDRRAICFSIAKNEAKVLASALVEVAKASGIHH